MKPSSTSSMETIRPYLSPAFDPHSLAVEVAHAAESLVDRIGALEVPISYQDLEKMAALRMIKQISKVRMNCGGSLIPIRGGFLVQLDSAQNEERTRTSLAHEIGHTFFYDNDRDVPRPIYWDKGGSRNVKAEEGLSWVAARTLLAPTQVLQETLKQDKNWPSIQGLLSLIRKFEVSPQIMIRRLQDLDSERPKAMGHAAIYSIHVSRTETNGPQAIGLRTKVWKFGKMKKMVAFNMNGPNVKLDRLLRLMEPRSLSEPYESEEILVRGELGKIPTARYNFGCAWEDRSKANLLAIVSGIGNS